MTTSPGIDQTQSNLMASELQYFKCPWPEKPVPCDMPSWMHYEVNEVTDNVTRTVDLYPDGHSIRNNIELAEREGSDQRPPEYRSLVHGPFIEFVSEGLIPITEAEFCILWEAASDKPWPPENESSM